MIFADLILQAAQANEMTTGQLTTALMSVLTLLVKDCGDQQEQSAMCHSLMAALWSSLELPSGTTTLH